MWSSPARPLVPVLADAGELTFDQLVERAGDPQRTPSIAERLRRALDDGIVEPVEHDGRRFYRLREPE